MKKMDWPGKYTTWTRERTLYISAPFTWELPTIRNEIMQRSLFWEDVVIGGPAAKLMPGYFDDLMFVTVQNYYPGVLQRVNPMATKTTLGCVNKCGFCGVPILEGGLVELADWPDLPVICDNNLLAASVKHFDRVIDRLIRWGWANFNQGLDSRRLTDYHAMRIAEIKEPLVYLALDNISYRDAWACAYDRLRAAGLAKRKIRSYALIGFNSDPAEAWERCRWIESHGVKAIPQWFHALNQLEHNIVTDEQASLGWTDYERCKIMQWYYQHKHAVKHGP
jgi:hypothetical protein